MDNLHLYTPNTEHFQLDESVFPNNDSSETRDQTVDSFEINNNDFSSQENAQSDLNLDNNDRFRPVRRTIFSDEVIQVDDRPLCECFPPTEVMFNFKEGTTPQVSAEGHSICDEAFNDNNQSILDMDFGMNNSILQQPMSLSLDKTDDNLPEINTIISTSNSYFGNQNNGMDVMATVGYTDIVQHTINTGDARPIRQPPYRTSPANRAEISRQTEQMLEQGIISPSVSPWAAPVVLALKKDNTMRFCVDYRKLNAVTVRDNYPLPLITDVLDSFSNAKHLTTLDLRNGYWQIAVAPESREKTAFITYEEHLKDLEEVFQRLRNANIKLNPKKCTFAKKGIEYLGHIVSTEGIEPNPAKIKAVQEYPRPKGLRDVRSFLGLANYYRRFLYTDASAEGIGLTLGQIQNGREVVISYAGRDLSPSERNFSASEREVLALVTGIRYFSCYLHNKRFEVYTDHAALKYLMNITHDSTGRLARWSLLVQQYDFEIKYRPGKNGVLYHIDQHNLKTEKGSYSQIVIPESLRYEVLVNIHDDVTAGHLEVHKTYDKLKARYFWKGMFQDTEHWIKSCVDCNMRKTPRNRHKVPLVPIPVDGPFDRIAIDAMGPFPVSDNGNRYILVISGYPTKWPEAFAVPHITAPVVARILVDQIIARHSCPNQLMSDRGKHFLSEVVQEVCKIFNRPTLPPPDIPDDTLPLHPDLPLEDEIPSEDSANKADPTPFR
ncbi:uncharacterized protein LOC125570179 [Nematostella vectensis]|uniref:uncharacterized protein LOC125570179 n=1 Tax=Nematostella vectensis TaxID=45351 RepID=UPI0020770BCF|nr:uncharacterized protein LOC125570179 [Nematostella vectensis]